MGPSYNAHAKQVPPFLSCYFRQMKFLSTEFSMNHNQYQSLVGLHFFSAGCHHTHPSDQYIIVEILTKRLGIVANPNTYSGKNYPYKPQGIAVVELID